SVRPPAAAAADSTSSHTPPPPCSTLFPYTTLFRSDLTGGKLAGDILARADVLPLPSGRHLGLPGRLRHLPDARPARRARNRVWRDRKSTRLNSSHVKISYAVFCLKKKNRTV